MRRAPRRRHAANPGLSGRTAPDGAALIIKEREFEAIENVHLLLREAQVLADAICATEPQSSKLFHMLYEKIDAMSNNSITLGWLVARMDVQRADEAAGEERRQASNRRRRKAGA